MSARRVVLAAVCVLLGVTGAGATWAAFSSTTQNAGNSVATASTTGHARVATGTYTGNGTDNRDIAVPFTPQVVIVKGATNQAGAARTVTMSGDLTKPIAGATALQNNTIQSLTAAGFQLGTRANVNGNGVRYDWVAFEAAQGVMQVGSYVGDGAARSITGLGFSPEYVMVLPANNSRAVSRAAGQDTTFQFDTDAGNLARVTSLDADGFSLGTSGEVNTAGQSYHYVAFNRRGGLSEMTTYTGTGAAGLTAYTGFQPDYAIVRRNTGAATAAHQRMSSQPPGESHQFLAGSLLTDSIAAFNAFDVGLGTNEIVNTSGETHSLIAFKSRPYAGGGGCSSPGTQTLSASADSYADENNAGANFGTATTFKVVSSNNKNARAFVRFDLPAIPSGCSVAFAKLRLNNRQATAGRILDLQTPSAGWSEGGITWANQPGVAAPIQSAVAAAGYMEWTVTDQVRGQYSSNYGFRISDATEDAGGPGGKPQTFDSREAAGNRPQLEVTFQ